MNDDEYRSLREISKDLADDALNYNPVAEPGEPRDPAWLRWTKFACLILFGAALVGFVAFCEYYLEQYGLARRQMGQAAADQHDPFGPMKIRIVIGAVTGGGLAMVYVVRCIIRKVDP
jgi:hypothetical protein